MGHKPTRHDLTYLEERFSFAESLQSPVPSTFLEASDGLLPESFANDASKANDAYQSLLNFFQISN